MMNTKFEGGGIKALVVGPFRKEISLLLPLPFLVFGFLFLCLFVSLFVYYYFTMSIIYKVYMFLVRIRRTFEMAAGARLDPPYSSPPDR